MAITVPEPEARQTACAADTGPTYTTLDDPLAGASASGQGTLTQGINDAGQIVGYYLDSNGNRHGFLYSGGAYTTLSDPLATNVTIASGINDLGQVVGYYGDNTAFHGFLYSNGTYTTVDNPLGGNNTRLNGINDSGQIAAQSFVYSNGAFITLDAPFGSVFPQRINNTGQFVGNYPGLHGFVATINPAMLDAVFNGAHDLTTLSGIAEANSSVSMFDKNNLIGTTTAGSDGTWTLLAKVSANVVHSFSETPSDLAGFDASSAGVTLYTPTAHKGLDGGNGNDVLIGGPNDTLSGEAGADTFVFNSSFGKETITDYAVSHDVLAFDSHLFSTDTASQVLSQTHDSSAGAVIAVDAHDTVTLTGVTVAQLQAAQNAHVEWVRFFAADPQTGSMGSSGSTPQLVQAMAGFDGGSGAAAGLNAAPLGADTSQQSFLTTPQHA
jgi:probable HAF family extracellular repeat protein